MIVELRCKMKGMVGKAEEFSCIDGFFRDNKSNNLNTQKCSQQKTLQPAANMPWKTVREVRNDKTDSKQLYWWGLAGVVLPPAIKKQIINIIATWKYYITRSYHFDSL